MLGSIARALPPHQTLWWGGFTGQRQDERNGLILFPARPYDPTLGRFLQPDPFIQDPADPQSLNRYAYVRNNPINLVDPSGNFFFIFAAIAAFISAAVQVAVAAAVTIVQAAFVAANALITQVIAPLINVAVNVATSALFNPQNFFIGAIAGGIREIGTGSDFSKRRIQPASATPVDLKTSAGGIPGTALKPGDRSSAQRQ